MFLILDYLFKEISNPTIGTKAKQLMHLKEEGYSVPRFAILPADIFAEIFVDIGSIEHTRDILQQIDRYQFPDVFFEEINQIFPEEVFFAVRSSMMEDNGKVQSFTGQSASFLFVTKHELVERIKDVWRSTFSSDAIAFRRKTGVQSTVGMAVVIQKMINPDYTGEVYGMNILSGDRSESLITAVPKVGKGLEFGLLEQDIYKLRDSRIDRQIARKRSCVVLDEAEQKGLTIIEIPRINQHDQVVPDSVILSLKDIANTIREKFGYFCHLSFCVSDGEIYFLQLDFLHSLDRLVDISSRNLKWDKSMLGNVFIDATTPLTYSVFSNVFAETARNLAGFLGATNHDIQSNEDSFSSILGYIEGQIYGNKLSVQKIISTIPVHALNPEYVQRLFGLQDLGNVKTDDKNRTEAWVRTLSSATRLYSEIRNTASAKEKYKEQFDAITESYQVANYKWVDAFELMRLYEVLERRIIKYWKAPITNELLTLIWKRLLKNRCQEYSGIFDIPFDEDLLRPVEYNLEERTPEKSIEDIARLISNDANLKVMALKNAQFFWNKLNANEEEDSIAQIRSAIFQYIDDFGNLAAETLELEIPTIRQAPQHIVELISKRITALEREEDEGDSEELRIQSAEAIMEESLKGKPIRRWKYHKTLKRTRELASLGKFYRLYSRKLAGIARQIFCSIGQRFREENILEYHDDIFYLTKEEIIAYLYGKSMVSDLKALVTIRKEEFEYFSGVGKMRSSRETFGIPYSGQFKDTISYAVESEIQIQAEGNQNGTVRGNIRFIDPSDSKTVSEGEILVMPYFDPDWISVFHDIAGLIVESDNASIRMVTVTREFDIPCIYGATGIFEKLQDRSHVLMDSINGKIVKIERSQN